MKSLMMPFSNNNGAMQFGNSGQNMGFINSKVFKPIRGGGARAPATDTSNYDSQPRGGGAVAPSGGMDFKNFMAQ
jgi:hypothetical protein|tara:strand:- start:681 stop:905 length:225 start_codon:yes stop_codon:yes gene_type:complete